MSDTELLCGDCFELMQGIPSESIDMILMPILGGGAMPESVMIDAVRYAILRVKEPLLLEGRECNAMVEYNTAQIKMLEDGNIGEGNKAKLLIHEIVHAILFERGLTEHAGDEELVSELAAGFVNLVRANPQLIAFLQK